MSDEEKMARLTQLAQRAWPEQRVVVEQYGERASVRVIAGGNVFYLLHPHAFEALEATLLVLTGTRFQVMIPPTRGYVPWRQDDELPSWVEKLASEWGRRVDGYREHDRKAGGATFQEVAQTLRDCANQLIESAKEAG